MTDLQNKYHTLQEQIRANKAQESLKSEDLARRRDELKLAKQKFGVEKVRATTQSSKDITGMFKDLAGGLHDVIGVASTISGMLG